MEKRILSYKLITTNDSASFRRIINEVLKEGYVFLGPLLVHKDEYGLVTYTRELVIYED